MGDGDVKQVTALLQKQLSQFHLRPVMGEEEVKHWFLPQENIIDTYVVEVRIATCIYKCADHIFYQDYLHILIHLLCFLVRALVGC